MPKSDKVDDKVELVEGKVLVVRHHVTAEGERLTVELDLPAAHAIKLAAGKTVGVKVD